MLHGVITYSILSYPGPGSRGRKEIGLFFYFDVIMKGHYHIKSHGVSHFVFSIQYYKK